MTILTAPTWLQLIVAAEAGALAVLSWKFGVRGLLWGAWAALASWFLLGFGASYLVSRLEGGGATPLLDIFMGAMEGTGRVALLGLPAVVVGAGLGLLLRRRRPRP